MDTDNFYDFIPEPMIENQDDASFFPGESSNEVNDLHAYYMSQFNLELEAGSKHKSKKSKDFVNYDQLQDNFSNDFELLYPNWHTDEFAANLNLENRIKSGRTDTNVFVEQIGSNNDTAKDPIINLDAIDFEDNSDCTNETYAGSVVSNQSDNVTLDFEQNCQEESNYEYIDDEDLIIDELCREDDNEICRMSPDLFTNEFLIAINKEKNLLPPIEEAFSKRYCNYTNRDAFSYQTEDNISNNLDENTVPNQDTLMINNLDSYSYPNNILNNIASQTNYILPDTPTSCTDFIYDDLAEDVTRKVSLSESIESDLQSGVSYYEQSLDNFEDDDLFVNLGDFGFSIEEGEVQSNHQPIETTSLRSKFEKKSEKDKYQGDRVCLWDHCFERHTNQTTLVEHIESSHVNTYKGDEFCCLWRECARARRPFNARYKLLIHMRVHSGHKPNRCHHQGCGKAFSRLENLKIHMRSHTGERPYACPAPHCRKAFSNSSDRAKHQRTHFNARPYACGAMGCGKRYTDPSSLRKHVKSHPHACARAAPPPRPRRAPPAAPPAPARSPAKPHTLRSIRDKLQASLHG